MSEIIEVTIRAGLDKKNKTLTLSDLEMPYNKDDGTIDTATVKFGPNGLKTKNISGNLTDGEKIIINDLQGVKVKNELKSNSLIPSINFSSLGFGNSANKMPVQAESGDIYSETVPEDRTKRTADNITANKQGFLSYFTRGPPTMDVPNPGNRDPGAIVSEEYVPLSNRLVPISYTRRGGTRRRKYKKQATRRKYKKQATRRK